jgi:hypothetical protein
MQPYFIPYAGYFRLFAAADVVVMFDCVQFPRRGWVHRNVLPTASGEPAWLTLPLAKAPQDVLIRDLSFADDAVPRLAAAATRFPLFDRALKAGQPFAERILELGGRDVATYLVGLVTHCTTLLGMQRPIVRSSTIPVPAELRAQDRVLAILRALGATAYVNPSGGRALYDRDAFNAAGIDLGFLTPYGGSSASILTRVLTEPCDAIAREIRSETVVTA